MEATLCVTRTGGQLKQIFLKKAVTTLGRDQDCDLRIPIESCSRHHCEIRIEGEQLFARDLGSANGTYVNNERIEEVELQAGDSLMIGPIVVRIRINGEPADLGAPPKKPDMEELLPTEPGSIMAAIGGESVTLVAPEGEIDNFDALSELATQETVVGEESIAIPADDEDPLAALAAMADDEKKKKK